MHVMEPDTILCGAYRIECASIFRLSGRADSSTFTSGAIIPFDIVADEYQVFLSFVQEIYSSSCIADVIFHIFVFNVKRTNFPRLFIEQAYAVGV